MTFVDSSRIRDRRRVDRRTLACLVVVGVVGLAFLMSPWFFGESLRSAFGRSVFRSQLVREAIWLATLVPLGFFAGRSIGLGAPDVRGLVAREQGATRTMVRGAALGAGIGVIVACAVPIILLVVEPERWIWWHNSLNDVRVEDSIGAIGGALEEEVVWRVGWMSSLAWIAMRVGRGRFPRTSILIALVLSSIAFGANHVIGLWIDFSYSPDASQWVEAALVHTWSQSLCGIVFGALYWRFGLAAAVASHATVNFVGMVLMPLAFAPALS